MNASLKRNISGIWVPVVTPFTPKGDLDLPALSGLVDWLLSKGIDGLLTLGSTGEAPNLSDEEAVQVVSCVVDAAAGRVPVLAGSGRPSTLQTQKTGKTFVEAGAQGLLVLTPFYYRGQTSAAGLRKFYLDVADHSEVPVFVYHIPQITNVWLQADMLVEILIHENIWGFKDSSNEGGPLLETLSRTDAIGFVGSGTRLVEGWDAGARGAILLIAHLVPELCLSLYDAWGQGDAERIKELSGHARHLTQALKGCGISAVKAVMALRGIDVGFSRQPISPVSSHQLQAIMSAVNASLEICKKKNAPGKPPKRS